MMDWAMGFQRGLHTQALAALKALPDAGVAGMPALIVAAFSFGMLHALLPGHGKSLLAAHYAGEGRWRGAILSSAILILTHVGSAIVIVLTGAAVIQRTLVGAGRAPILERSSHILIVLVGLWLLWQAFRSHHHDHGRSGPALAFVGGLIPCPLTTFIMAYAVANGLLLAGLLLSATFASGMIVTVVAFPLAAILLRGRLVAMLDRTGGLRRRVGVWLEVTAALAVTALGLWPLIWR
jgi:nickel/cobalt exporter